MSKTPEKVSPESDAALRLEVLAQVGVMDPRNRDAILDAASTIHSLETRLAEANARIAELTAALRDAEGRVTSLTYELDTSSL